MGYRFMGCSPAELQPLRKLLHRTQGGLCAICGEPIRRVWQVSLEHVIPRSRRGADALGNVAATHGECNNRKSDRWPTGCELIWLLAVNARLGVEPSRW